MNQPAINSSVFSLSTSNVPFTTTNVNNVNSISYFADFLEPTILATRPIHGTAGSTSFGQVAVNPLSFNTMGILGLRAGVNPSVSSAAHALTYPNNNAQGHQVFLNQQYVNRKYFSRFHLYGSLTRAYYHFLIGNVAPNSLANQFYTTNTGQIRYFLGVVGCSAGTPIRQNSTTYAVGDIVTLTGSIYRWRCITAGNSSASQPTFNTVINSTTTDNTVVWNLETFNTNGYWAVLNLNNTLPSIGGNQAELIITDIPMQTLVPYKVVYDFYMESSVKKVRVYMQAGSGNLNLIADNLNASSTSILETPYYAVQREQVGTTTIGNSENVVPWLEIDYFGFTTTMSR